MASKAHLRQRHGSDNFRLEPHEENHATTPSSAGSTGKPAWSEDQGVHAAQSPSSRPRGLTLITPAGPSSHASLSPASTNATASRHRSRSSAYMSPQEAATILGTSSRTPTNNGPSPLRISPIPSYLSSPVESTPIEKLRPQLPIVPSWTNMPAKPQLAILAASRFVDFFQMAALQTYMVHQLKSFDPSLPDATISHQAGVLQGAFTAAQIVTSILWGRLADRPTVGRKLVLVIGLAGTGISMIGVGFSTTFSEAVFWRVIGGAINGTVGAARTMVAETVPKQWHPRAFLLLPAAFNVANVAGPILGGMLVEPVRSFPSWFGPGGRLAGAGDSDGVWWMKAYPFAAANMLSTILLLAEAALVQVYLRETLKGYQGTPWSELFDPRKFIASVRDTVSGLLPTGSRAVGDASSLKMGLLSGTSQRDSFELDDRQKVIEGQSSWRKPAPPSPPPQRRLPFRRIWTSNVLWTLLTIAIFDFHMGAFNNLWTLFLSTSRAYIPTEAGMTDSPERLNNLARRGVGNDLNQASLFKFAGGLAFPPPTIGLAMAVLGFIGVALQFLLYPWANGRFGLMRCFRCSLFLFPLAYLLAPYISLLPSASQSPEPASGFWVWAGIALVLTLQVTARTFALPASIILLNNSSPHPSVLATIHGLGQADSATFRTLGPILAGGWYGTWVERGVVGMAWWLVALISVIGCLGSFYVRNGSGHEILLEGEEEEGGERGVGSMVQRG